MNVQISLRNEEEKQKISGLWLEWVGKRKNYDSRDGMEFSNLNPDNGVLVSNLRPPFEISSKHYTLLNS